MKVTKIKNEPNQFKLEATMTKGKFLALLFALEARTSTLSQELRNDLDKAIDDAGVTL